MGFTLFPRVEIVVVSFTSAVNEFSATATVNVVMPPRQILFTHPSLRWQSANTYRHNKFVTKTAFLASSVTQNDKSSLEQTPNTSFNGGINFENKSSPKPVTWRLGSGGVDP